MAALTLADFRTEGRANLGNRTELASDDTRVNRFLNKAQERIVRRTRFRELNINESITLSFTGTLATDKIFAYSSFSGETNPRTFYSLRVIDGASSEKLTYVPHRAWDKTFPYPESLATGRPSRYTRYASQLEFWRIPNAAYTVEVRMATWPTDLTTTSQVSDLLNKDDLIIWMATHVGFLSLGNRKSAANALSEYRDVWAEARIEEMENPDFSRVPDDRNIERQDYWADPFVRSSP